MKTIGITTTVPVEVLMAAGYKVVDLNNIFVTAKNHMKYIDRAEKDGFPKSLCTWIKGIYGVCIEEGITEVVGVLGGDCSNTKALVEVLKMKGIKVYPFMYPTIRTIDNVKKSIDDFIELFNVSIGEVEKTRLRLNKLRQVAKEIDILTYKEGKVSGFENHLFQVSLSDFNSNVGEFEDILLKKKEEYSYREQALESIRIGYIGVPPMTADIYDYVKKYGANIVYNEVQREFAFPRGIDAENIYMQYYDYTYPYDIDFRLEHIKEQIKERKIDAIIHYTQAFCYRAVEDIVIKNNLNIPVLNIEGDKETFLDGRTKLRIEAFLDMISDLKEMNDI